MSLTPVDPQALGRPIGYTNGMRGRGEILFVAGQVAFDASQRIVSPELTAQFAKALDNVLSVVREAGGSPTDIARMTVYVTDKTAYLASRREIGGAWRERLGKHFPAMTLVEVKSLLEDGALVEIEATAVLPETRS